MSLTKIQPATEAAVAASTCIVSAPPFLAPWCVINSPEPKGFWKAVKVDPWPGAWVMQLGVNPHPATAPYTAGELIAGFRWSGSLPTGYHTFLVRFANGPITANASGGQVSAKLFLNVDGVGTSQVAQSRCVQYLQISRFLVGGIHTISLGGIIQSAFKGSASPYAEILMARAEFTHFPAGIGLSAGAQAEAAPESVAGEPEGERLFDEKKLQTVEIVARETAQARLDSSNCVLPWPFRD